MSSLLSATLATFPLGSAPSYPEEVEVHTVRGEHVTLITATVPEAKTNIIPGQTARWDVGVHVNAPSAGTISAGLSVSGDFPLEASVYSCPAPWTAPPTGEGSIEEECPADLEAMTVFRPVHPGHETDWVGSFSSEEEERWLRVEARMPLDSPHETQNSTSRLRFHISGDGHEISSELPGGGNLLPQTRPVRRQKRTRLRVPRGRTTPRQAHRMRGPVLVRRAPRRPDGSHRPASPCSSWWEPVCSLSCWAEPFIAARRR